MQFICAYISGSTAWFLGTDYTVGTPKYDTSSNYKGINNDSLNWSNACACSWTVYLYLKSGSVTVENCKIPTQSEANMIDRWIRANGFPYWTSTKYDNSNAYRVSVDGVSSMTPRQFSLVVWFPSLKLASKPLTHIPSYQIRLYFTNL